MSIDNRTIKDTECRLKIGDVCCSLRFKDPAYSSYLKQSFKGFISKEEPELTIDISVNATLDEEEADLPDSVFISNSVNGSDFLFHDGLIKITLNLEEKRCVVSISRKREGIYPVKQLNTILFIVYYTLMKHNHPGKSKNNFLVHACAVSRDGVGYAFSGPSESGKSTIARLSSDYRVLNDEMVIIKKENGNYIVSSTPFRGDFFDSEEGSAPLKAIFLIKHGNKKNVIKKISKSEFITRILREVAYPDPWLSMNREKVFLEMLDFCADVASEVPFYELQFLPDKRFWDSIDELKREERRCDDAQ
jgi:hypothetical protein